MGTAYHNIPSFASTAQTSIVWNLQHDMRATQIQNYLIQQRQQVNISEINTNQNEYINNNINMLIARQQEINQQLNTLRNLQQSGGTISSK